jgi:hypothetical protein
MPMPTNGYIMAAQTGLRFIILKMIPPIFLMALLELAGQVSLADEKEDDWADAICGSWVLWTDGNHRTQYYLDADQISPADYEFSWTPLYFVEMRGQSPESLEEYWASHIPSQQDWELLRYNIASAYGLMPFAYLFAGGGTVAFYDGARYWLGRKNERLAIPGDFPCGTYIFFSFVGKKVFELTVNGTHCSD